VLVELAFWAVAAPLGNLLVLSDGRDDTAKLIGGGVIFLNVVRLLAPLKVPRAVVALLQHVRSLPLVRVIAPGGRCRGPGAYSGKAAPGPAQFWLRG